MASKYALITGCTTGSIGYFLAREFVSKGYHVFATARRTSNMGDLASGSKQITLLALDITSAESIAAVHEVVKSKCGGKLDIIFHNAGYRSLAMAIETTSRESARMMNVNFTGVVELNRVFAEMVIATQGSIVFTSSLSGFMPQPSHSVYCASKAALDLYARILRIELQPFRVKVIVVHTGGIRTGMTESYLEVDEGSRYRYLTRQINQTWANLQSGYMEPDAFAKKVVGKVTQSSICGPPTDIWAGNSALLVRILEFLNLNWAYDSVFARMFGFNKVAPKEV